jgi:hypothetical protein
MSRPPIGTPVDHRYDGREVRHNHRTDLILLDPVARLDERTEQALHRRTSAGIALDDGDYYGTRGLELAG